jgi:hypothetical protein
MPIPDPQEPIALSETQHQLAAETDAPSQAVSVPAPPETLAYGATADTSESQLTATSNPPRRQSLPASESNLKPQQPGQKKIP